MAQGRAEIRRFKAVDDQGNEVTIVEIKPTDFRRTARGELVNVSPHYTIFELTNGQTVSRLKDGSYKVFNTGQIMREVG